MGLSLVKNLTQLHGGTVELRSEGPGRGSEFVLRLPLLAGPAAEEATPAPPPAPEHVHALRVLVVDDNCDAAETLGDLISLWGHHVTLAFDGNAAIALAQESPFDVILLDIGLPGRDGYEIARCLRSSGVTDPMLVALTGYGQDEDRRRALEAGFNLHMTKPVDPKNLEATLLARS